MGRTVLLTVTQWFVRDARETTGDFLQVRDAWRGVIPYFMEWIFMGELQLKSPEWRKANEIGKWSMEMMGYPLGLIYSTVGHYMRM